MDTIFLYNQNKEMFSTEVIRYFLMDNKKYFIFTLNEIDENGYIQLYVSTIENENGQLVTKNITDEDDWNKFKDTIQNIVVNNRNNIKNTTDIDYKELNNIVVTEFRIFKLKESVAKELGLNKNVINKPKEPTTLEAASAQKNDLTIEEILKQVSDSAKSAREELPNNVVIENPAPTLATLEDNFDIEKPKTESIIDYKIKYESLLETVKTLEKENMRLIEDLIKAKAKIETIKDILN